MSCWVPSAFISSTVLVKTTQRAGFLTLGFYEAFFLGVKRLFVLAGRVLICTNLEPPVILFLNSPK